jgi:translation initiation factor 3 subunit C
MSRFWAGASSSESDNSDDDDSYYSSGDDDNKKAATGAGANRWVDFSDSDSDDDEVRVAKSGKDRAIDTFNKHIAAIRKAMKDRDYYQIQTEFDELAKAMIKSKKTLQAGVPRPLVRILVDLEDYIPERLADKAAFKKLSARQGRSLNRMKLTLKKHNKPYSVVMEHYRKNPDTGDDDDDDDEVDDDDDDDDSSSSSSDSDSDDEKVDAKKKKVRGPLSSLWLSLNIVESDIWVHSLPTPPQTLEDDYDLGFDTIIIVSSQLPTKTSQGCQFNPTSSLYCEW